jgi:hypothetical protein
MTDTTKELKVDKLRVNDKTGETVLEIMLDHKGNPSLMVSGPNDTRKPWLTANTKEEG